MKLYLYTYGELTPAACGCCGDDDNRAAFITPISPKGMMVKIKEYLKPIKELHNIQSAIIKAFNFYSQEWGILIEADYIPEEVVANLKLNLVPLENLSLTDFFSIEELNKEADIRKKNKIAEKDKLIKERELFELEQLEYLEKKYRHN